MKPKTWQDYSQYCKRFIVPSPGAQKLRNVKLPVINKFYMTMNNDNCTVEIVRHTHRVLYGIFADTVCQGYRLTNAVQYGDSFERERSREAQGFFLRQRIRYS